MKQKQAEKADTFFTTFESESETPWSGGADIIARIGEAFLCCGGRGNRKGNNGQEKQAVLVSGVHKAKISWWGRTKPDIISRIPFDTPKNSKPSDNYSRKGFVNAFHSSEGGDCVLPNSSPTFEAKYLHPSFCRIFSLTHLSVENSELPDATLENVLTNKFNSHLTFPITRYSWFRNRKLGNVYSSNWTKDEGRGKERSYP